MPRRGDDLADFLVDGRVIFGGVWDPLVALCDGTVGFLDDCGFAARWEARVGRGDVQVLLVYCQQSVVPLEAFCGQGGEYGALPVCRLYEPCSKWVYGHGDAE